MYLAKKELVDYVEKGLKKGRHVRHIKRKLAHAGHPIHEIEDAVRHVLLTKPHLKHIRQKLFVGFFVVAAILISAISIFTFEGKEKIFDYQENFTYSQMSDELILRHAMETGDITGCKYVRQESARYACLERSWTENNCFYFILMGEGVDECYLRLALRDTDGDYCFRMSDRNLRESCLNMTFKQMEQGNVEVCNGRSWCILRFIELNGISEEYCGAMSNDISRRDCLVELAQVTRNKNICRLLDAEAKRDCFKDLYDTFESVAEECTSSDIAYLFSAFDEHESASQEWISLGLSDDASSWMVCFLAGAEEVISKGFYTCEDLLEFSDYHIDDFNYLKDFRKVYGFFAVYYSDELSEDAVNPEGCESEGEFLLYRCNDGFEWCKG